MPSTIPADDSPLRCLLLFLTFGGVSFVFRDNKWQQRTSCAGVPGVREGRTLPAAPRRGPFLLASRGEPRRAAHMQREQRAEHKRRLQMCSQPFSAPPRSILAAALVRRSSPGWQPCPHECSTQKTLRNISKMFFAGDATSVNKEPNAMSITPCVPKRPFLSGGPCHLIRSHPK